MPYKDLESLPLDEEHVRRWAFDLNPRTAQNYAYYFLRYVEWAKGRGYWNSAQAMLKEYAKLKQKQQFRHVDILKEYIKSRKTGITDKRITWHAVRSFYEYHRQPLPALPRSEASRLFKPSDEDKQRSLELGTLKLEDVQKLVLNAPPPYKAAFMVMFQGAMSLAEFTQFNTKAYKRVLEELEKPGPTRVDLYREKTSREKVEKYYTFIGEDAKGLVKEWLAMKSNGDVDALFVTFNKNTKCWVPLNGRLVGDMVTKVAKKIGLIKPNGLNRYHVHAHEFRDLFKSMCTLSGVSNVASEFFLGHTIDKLGYDKSPQYSEDWFKAEYLKVEPRLNILSNPSGGAMTEEAKKDMLLSLWREQAKMYGIDPAKIRIEREDMTLDEEVSAIQAEIKRFIAQALRLRQNVNNNHYESRVIAEKDLESYLKAGWEFQARVNRGKIVVRKPREA